MYKASSAMKKWRVQPGGSMRPGPSISCKKPREQPAAHRSTTILKRDWQPNASTRMQQKSKRATGRPTFHHTRRATSRKRLLPAKKRKGEAAVQYQEPRNEQVDRHANLNQRRGWKGRQVVRGMNARVRVSFERGRYCIRLAR